MRSHALTRLRRLLMGVLPLAAVGLIAVPSTANAAPAQQVEDLGVPISSYLILDSVLAKDAQGQPTLYGSTYNAPSDGVTFFGVDPVTGAVRTQLTMPGAYGGYHVTVATNGRIYLGPEDARSKPEIWEYDPQTDKVRIAATAPEGLFCFGMAASPNGDVYCGAYGKGIYEYNPATGGLRFVASTETFPKGLLPLDDTHLLIAEGTPAKVVVLDTVTGASREILPAKYDNYSFAYNAVRIGQSVYVQLVTPGIKLVRFDAKTLNFIDEVPTVTGMGFAPYEGNGFTAVGPDPAKDGATEFYTGRPLNGGYDITPTGIPTGWSSGPRIWPIEINDQTWYASVGSTGQVGRWNPETGQVVTHQLNLPGNPTNVTAVTRAPDGSMCGGTYETNSLFCYHPDTGKTDVLGNVAPGRTGEILSMTSTQGKLFMGSYINNVVTVYDPSKPWAPSDQPGGNPLDLGPVGDQQYRPYGMTVGPDGRVWVASSAAYGVLRGALTAIDPQTHAVQSFRGLAADQHFFAITSAEGNLVAGTSVYGDDTNAGGQAEVLVVTTSGSVISTTMPVAGATRILALTTAPDGSVFGSTDNGYWFRFDSATGKVTASGGGPYGTITDLITGPDGMVYGAGGGGVFRINPADDSFELVATPGTGYYRTLAFDSAGRLYWGSGAHLFRATL